YDPWVAHIERNLLGLEIERSLPGGVKSSWSYDRAGRPESHTVNSNGRDSRRRYYRWDASQRLKEIVNGIGSGVVKFGHDDIGNLAWAQYEDGEYDYRLPDKAGNYYRAQDRQDRKYGPGGQLQTTGDARYQYDEEGNLVKKADWEYEWYGNGLLKKVIRPDGKVVSFRYDCFGRRIEKEFNDCITRFVWNGNIPLHEWSYAAKDRPVISVSELGDIQQDHPEPVPVETLATWIFEEGTFAPAAKLINGKQYSIITDHIGTPCEAYDESGQKVWECELDIYGKVRKLAGETALVPFRYPGQYEDRETGLYYNRYRYYAPEEGRYISQDPVGLLGGPLPYGYVNNPAGETDVLGLWGDEGRLIGAKATVSVVDKNGNVVKSVTTVSDPDIAHAEIRGLNQLTREGGFRGQEVVISDVTGTFTKAGELPIGMCSDCRTDIFDILQKGGASGVTIPMTIAKKFQRPLYIPAENFAKAQAELNAIRHIDHDRTRSDEAWKVLKKYETCR
ncbi:MAG TPA: RHS repeat-associated core domain-containing protein, partial [Chitinophaga sp.]